MEKKNRYLSAFGDANYNKFFDLCIDLVWIPTKEIYYGITMNSINWFVCLLPGCLFNALVLTGLDTPFFKFIKLDWFFPPSKSIPYLIYCFLGAFSGMIGWGFFQAIIHVIISRKLTTVFLISGLKNAVGKLPSFVFDKPIDQYTRKMRLTRAGLSLSQFQGAKDNLESALHAHIDEITENREKGTVDIVYASKAIPAHVKLTNIEKIGPNKFLIGETRARRIEVDLNDVPHFLVGGQSGGGKSTFLRQLITTLYLNNKTYKFILLDLKDGLEFQFFEKLERISVAATVSAAVLSLKKLELQLKNRMEFLKTVKCKDIAAFLEKPLGERKALEKEHFGGQLFSRVILVVDEAAALFMAGEKSQANQTQKAKGYAIKLAAQGRAVGIHLIIATQRPEVKAVDGLIKANLPGVIAFRMPNNASSMTILDNNRAANLPKIDGRAIWKCGMEMIELQAPFLAVSDAEPLLKPYRTENPVVEEETNEVEC